MDWFLALTIIVPAAAVLIMVLWFDRQSANESKWGVNFNIKNTRCPNCNAGVPKVRIPRSRREALWGGWTCNHCGARMDKYGKPV